MRKPFKRRYWACNNELGKQYIELHIKKIDLDNQCFHSDHKSIQVEVREVREKK